MKRLMAILTIVVCTAGAAYAADSPQFRGPARDGRFPETGLLKEWPEGGPPVAWVTNGLGKAYSSVSVVDGAIYATGKAADGLGYLYLLDLDGNIKNRAAYGKETDEEQAPASRSTPTIDGNRAYVMSGPGVVSCFQIPELEKLWEVDALKRFGAELSTWHYAESVLIDGNRLICTPGGPDASVVALDKMTGETIWTSKGLSDAASYCSADIIEHGGRRLILTMTAKLVVGLDPETGEVLWTHRHETDHDIHAVTPVYQDGLIFYTGGYGSGSGVVQLSPDATSVTQTWKDETLDCQHHGVVLHEGHIYGTGHKTRELVCLEMKTGKIAWRTREIRQGVTVFADGMLYVYEGPGEGTVSLVKATPSGFERTGSFEVTEGTDKHWAHPTIVGGRLYIRHGDALIAYDIAAK
jgi:outer membrane protein assembly factor BamB